MLPENSEELRATRGRQTAPAGYTERPKQLTPQPPFPRREIGHLFPSALRERGGISNSLRPHPPVTG